MSKNLYFNLYFSLLFISFGFINAENTNASTASTASTTIIASTASTASTTIIASTASTASTTIIAPTTTTPITTTATDCIEIDQTNIDLPNFNSTKICFIDGKCHFINSNSPDETLISNCKCIKNYYFNNKERICSPITEGRCNSNGTLENSNETCNKIRNGICLNENCICDEGYFLSNNECILKISYGKICSNDNQCQSNMRCDQTDLKCKCKKYYWLDEREFKCNPIIGSSCYSNGTLIHSNQTCYNAPNALCINQSCACSNLYFHSNDKCIWRKSYNEACSNDNQCRLNLECNQSKCKCKKYHRYNHREFQCIPIVGSYCSRSSLLWDYDYSHDDHFCKQVPNAECKKGEYDYYAYNFYIYRHKSTNTRTIEKCKCIDTHYQSNHECILKKQLNQTCSETYQCASDLKCMESVIQTSSKSKCINSSDLRCNCEKYHWFDHQQEKCVPIITSSCHNVNGTLERSNQTCNQVPKSKCINGTCKCDQTHFQSYDECILKKSFQQSCIDNQQCGSNLKCIRKSSHTKYCVCDNKYDYFDDLESKCKPIIGSYCYNYDYYDREYFCNEVPNTICKKISTSVLLNAYRWICQCKDTHYQLNDECVFKRELNQTCSKTDQCISNLICTNSISTSSESDKRCKCQSNDIYEADKKLCAKLIVAAKSVTTWKQVGIISALFVIITGIVFFVFRKIKFSYQSLNE